MGMTALTLARWLRRRAENVAAALLFVMFAGFILQIVLRYVFNWPHGWASELSVLCWLWGVLWGAAFVTTERDEMRFDVVHGLLGATARRWLMVVTGTAVLVLYGVSLPAVADYILFMRVERTAYLKIRFDFAFSIYILFAVAVLGRYAWLVWRALRGETPATLLQATQADSRTTDLRI
jgi:C4-dicarboxylate transporter, DctQ subunit